MQLNITNSILIALNLYCAGFVFGQSSTDSTSRFNIEKSTFTVGGVHGIHPKYVPRKGNITAFYVEADQHIKIGKRTFSLAGRYSNEPLRSGAASYISFNLLPEKYNLKEIGKLKQKISFRKQALEILDDTLLKLKNQIAFLKQKELEDIQFEMDSSALPDPSGISFEKVRTELFDTSRIRSEHTEDLDNLLKKGWKPKWLEQYAWKDRLENRYNLELASDSLQQRIDSMKDTISTEESDLTKIYSGKSLKFPGSITNFNIGLASLSKGSLGNNSLPINGFKVGGNYKNFFYELASGVTIKNQLFSNLSFEQFIDQSGNLFNASTFSAVNSSRLVGSVVLGWGKKDQRFISLESFYTGKTLQEIRKKDTVSNSVPQVVEQIAFKLPIFNKLTLDGALGTCLSDTMRNISKDNLGWKSELNYAVSPQMSTYYNYKKLGMAFDGWSQGLRQRGLEHHEVGTKFKIGKIIRASLFAGKDIYNYYFQTKTSLSTNKIGLTWDQQFKPRIAWINNYTLLELRQTATKPTLNHLARTGIILTNTIKGNQLVTQCDYNFARITTKDSSVQIQSSSLKSRLNVSKYFFELGGTYFDNSGTSRLAGKVMNLQPAAGITTKKIKIDISYTFSFSEQFGKTEGFKGHLNYALFDKLAVDFTMQKWLPSEYVFFWDETYTTRNPFYMNCKFILTLKSNK